MPRRQSRPLIAPRPSVPSLRTESDVASCSVRHCPKRCQPFDLTRNIATSENSRLFTPVTSCYLYNCWHRLLFVQESLALVLFSLRKLGPQISTFGFEMALRLPAAVRPLRPLGFAKPSAQQARWLATPVHPVTQDSGRGPTAMVFLNMGGPSTTDEVGDFLSRLFVRTPPCL